MKWLIKKKPKKGHWYKLWAYTYSDGNGDYREWEQTIYRNNELTEEQKNKLVGKFADELAYKHYCNITLCGCHEVEQ